MNGPLARDLRRARQEVNASLRDLAVAGAALKPGSAARTEIWELLTVLRRAEARIGKLLEMDNG